MRQGTPYDTLLMDLGNVMLRAEPELLRPLLAGRGVDADRFPVDHFSSLCLRYESGQVDTPGFLDAFSRLTGLGGDELIPVWNGIFPRDALIGVTCRACSLLRRAGIRIVAFSNTNELHVEYMNETYPELMDLFDLRLYSHQVHAVKPEAGMYLAAIGQPGVESGRTLYFDDKPENVAAGRDFGFDSHVFDRNVPNSFLGHLPQEWLDIIG